MHNSVQEFVKSAITKEMANGKSVLEVGSLNVNGSARPYIESLGPKSYLGIDMRAGSGVDKVCDIAKMPEEAKYSLVVCTEMLEHAKDWRQAISKMKSLAGEYILITARGPGFPRHGYPEDYWRFTTEDMLKIFADFTILRLEEDRQGPGVFVLAKKGADLSEIELMRAPQ
jgi:hypothetical protein